MVAGSTLFFLAALALGVKAEDDDLFHVNIGPIAQGRIDPIVDPGKFAGHTHTIFGASNFRNVLNTPEEQLKAGCSSTAFQKDKSNYWIPTLYFINKDNKYEPVNVSGGRAYYIFRGEKNVPFPDGFRMIAGNANNRDANNISKSGIGYHCRPRKEDQGTPNDRFSLYLPNGTLSHQCEDMVTRMFFPSCGWANQSLDSWDHSSHVTFPISGPQGDGLMYYDPWSGSQCPETHPVKYPLVNLEVYWRLTKSQKEQWRTGKDAINLIWSNGDTHGTSFHADFVFGWEQDLFRKMTEAKCTSKNCPANEFKDEKFIPNCRFEGMVPDEPLGFIEPLDQLPGCNPRWDFSQGDHKPKDCPWFKGDPGWTPANAVVKVMGQINPVALDLPGANFTQEGLLKYSKDDLYAYQPVDDVHHEYGALSPENWWPNRWWNGTQEDIDANKKLETAVNKQPKVIDMDDDSAFSDINPTNNIVGQDKWATGVEVGTFTKWEYHKHAPTSGEVLPTKTADASSNGLPSANNLAVSSSSNAGPTGVVPTSPTATPSVVGSESGTAFPSPTDSGVAVRPGLGSGGGSANGSEASASESASGAVGTPLGGDEPTPAVGTPLHSGSGAGDEPTPAVGTPLHSGSGLVVVPSGSGSAAVPSASGSGAPAPSGSDAAASDSGTPVASGSGTPAPTSPATASGKPAPGRCRPKHRRRHLLHRL
ncbi:hypothetical protein VHUM_03072 [Vanrija humicola]|uniref:DUF1996 domain-containing protein n=1 Tax=Vanrija humicola TaxID=5417 RepID=A0A7D8V3V8_VANHU|nr:hypothetical protein VHUM_03072 [Vanrija humicola]